VVSLSATRVLLLESSRNPRILQTAGFEGDEGAVNCICQKIV